MNFLTKCYSLVCWLTALTVFTPKSRTVPSIFNENTMPMISY